MLTLAKYWMTTANIRLNYEPDQAARPFSPIEIGRGLTNVKILEKHFAFEIDLVSKHIFLLSFCVHLKELLGNDGMIFMVRWDAFESVLFARGTSNDSQ